MTLNVFNLLGSTISYRNGERAARIPRPVCRSAKSEDAYTLGIVDFHDDHSVHADHWEHHPGGDEILCVLEGRLLVTVDRDAAVEDVVVEQGQAVIVPQQTWHRLRVLEPGRLLFGTPGAGCQRRPHRTGAASRINPAAPRDRLPSSHTEGEAS